jgi:hypothetical protein
MSQVVRQQALTGLVVEKGVSMKEEFLERVRIAGEEKKAKKGTI